MIPNQDAAIAIRDTSANPGPLGLFGFGMTTVLLNIHNAGFFELNSMIMGMGIFYGGIAQLIAGILESKKNNSFGMTAFISFGSFWLVLFAMIALPKLGLLPETNPDAFGTFLLLWGIFTLLLFFGTLRLNKALQFVFGSLVILFFLLAAANYSGNPTILKIAGYEGIIVGGAAIYTGIATLLNEMYNRTVLPLG